MSVPFLDDGAPKVATPRDVIVIGAGVIGLSSALRLQLRGYNVTVVARDLPQPFETIDSKTQINYASAWAGAHNRWVPPMADSPTDMRDHLFSVHTFHAMEAIEKHGSAAQAGLTFLPGVEYLQAPVEPYSSLTEMKAKELGMPGFRRLEASELPQGMAWGCEYRTWCVNPMMYCMFLLRALVFNGGKVRQVTVRDPVELFAEYEGVHAVVNCSGIGFGDPNVFPTRGQTCLVRQNCHATITAQLADGSWSFVIPRGLHGGTIIGGTKEPHDWNPHPDPATRARLLNNFRAVHPQILPPGEHEYVVIRDIVGRRPTRVGGLRLEGELLPNGKPIVHAYGLGGRGYELSWGVATEVERIMMEEFP